MKPSTKLAALVSPRHTVNGRMSPKDLKLRQTIQTVPAALSVRNRVSMEVASPSMLDPDLDGFNSSPKAIIQNQLPQQRSSTRQQRTSLRLYKPTAYLHSLKPISTTRISNDAP